MASDGSSFYGRSSVGRSDSDSDSSIDFEAEGLDVEIDAVLMDKEGNLTSVLLEIVSAYHLVQFQS